LYIVSGSKSRGQADGFGIEILPKLKDVKNKVRYKLQDEVILDYYFRNFTIIKESKA